MTVAVATEDRIVSLLGAGVSAAACASALGITESAISQRLAQPEFAEKVAFARYEVLQRHNQRDGKLDELEDTLIAKLRDSLEYVMPNEVGKIARLLQIVNSAKRRGAASPQDSNLPTRAPVTILMPQTIKNKFVTNIHQQVIQVGSQDLVTIQAASLNEQLAKSKREALGNEDVNSRGTGANSRN